MRICKPSDVELARDAMNDMSDDELAKLVFECIGSRRDVIEYIIDNFDETVMDLADDEWQGRCEYRERHCGTHLSPAGDYSL